MSDHVKYDSRTIWFHWLTAGLIVLMWGLAHIIDFFPIPERVWPRSLHIVTGVALIAIVLARLVWRRSGGTVLPPADAGILHLVATVTQFTLYGLVLITLGLGVVSEAVRADNIFYLFRLPSIAPGDKALRGLLENWHGTASNAILILAGLHGTAALYHHFLRRDGVLRRML